MSCTAILCYDQYRGIWKTEADDCKKTFVSSPSTVESREIWEPSFARTTALYFHGWSSSYDRPLWRNASLPFPPLPTTVHIFYEPLMNCAFPLPHTALKPGFLRRPTPSAPPRHTRRSPSPNLTWSSDSKYQDEQPLRRTKSCYITCCRTQ